jgi:glucose-1-phosphate thymidylyltransferase
MKGVLLHGGSGTRLRPLTHTGPKQLIPVAGKPISQYCLEDLKAAGVEETAVVLGDLWPERVVEQYGDGSELGMKLTYIRQGQPLGLAHAVQMAESFVGEDLFVVYLGDNLLRGGIAEHAQVFRAKKPDAMILLSKVVDPQRFGVAEFDAEGKLKRLVEKPRQPPSPYALVGVYFFTPRIFQAIGRLRPSGRGELEITEAIQNLLDEGCSVDHKFVEGWWKDTGTPEDILEANRLVLDERLEESTIMGSVERGASIQGRVRIEKGALIMDGATIRGPACIGHRTRVGEGAYVGPYTSVGSDCELSACEIENTIVMDGCVINSTTRIIDSLIGPQTEISRQDKNTPRGYRLILGERSSLRL